MASKNGWRQLADLLRQKDHGEAARLILELKPPRSSDPSAWASEARRLSELWGEAARSGRTPAEVDGSLAETKRRDAWRDEVRAAILKHAPPKADRARGKPPATMGRPVEHQWRAIDAEIARRITTGKPRNRAQLVTDMLGWCGRTFAKEAPRSEMAKAVNAMWAALGGGRKV